MKSIFILLTIMFGQDQLSVPKGAIVNNDYYKNNYEVKQNVGTVFYRKWNSNPCFGYSYAPEVLTWAKKVHNYSTVWSTRKKGLVDHVNASKKDKWDIHAEIVFVQRINSVSDTVVFCYPDLMEINRTNLPFDSTLFWKVVEDIPWWNARYIHK